MALGGVKQKRKVPPREIRKRIFLRKKLLKTMGVLKNNSGGVAQNPTLWKEKGEVGGNKLAQRSGE